jgi:ribosomal protein L16 Arg81 hydroxylase
LWPPSIPHPVQEIDLPRPDEPAELDVTLRAGDALFFPRGWWHRPAGTGEPAMHLTFGIYRPSGLDLVRWLCDRASENADGIRFDRNLDRPWDETIIEEFLATRSRRGSSNRLTFDLPDIGA